MNCMKKASAVGLLSMSLLVLVPVVYAESSPQPPPSKSESAEAPQRGGKREHRAGEHRPDRPHRLGRFLKFMQEYTRSVQDPYQAASLAALGIVQHYKAEGTPEKAATEIEPMVAKARDQRMRNVLLYALRQIYEQSGQTEKFLEVNRQILQENVTGVPGDVEKQE